MKFVPKGPINNIPALVQIMAWRRPGDKPLSEPIMVSLPTHICVTRHQWVNITTAAFNFDSEADVFDYVSKVLKQKISRPRVDLNHQNLRIPTECSTIWATEAWYLLSHVFEHWFSQCRYFVYKDNIRTVNCARAATFTYNSRMGVIWKIPKFFRL